MNSEKKQGEKPPLKVEDKRHWARRDAGEDEAEAAPSTQPTILDEYRRRAEAAEKTLQDYIAAFKQSQAEQEEFRARLTRDVERRVDLQFGRLVSEMLETVDDLDLALSHVRELAEAAPLARGVVMARDRFLAALERNGVTRIELDGTPFDPNVAEAMRVDEVPDPDRDGKVTETLRPGYALGERVIRAARVAVGRYG